MDAETVSEQSIAPSAGTKSTEETETETLDDSKITTAVVTQLLVAKATPVEAVAVETNEGIVRLNGSVNAILRKERAEEIAGNVKGVRAVVNNIEVEPPVVADGTLVENIEIALADDPATDSFEIRAEAKEGSVVLTGEVESYAEAQLATTVTKNVRGVAAVTNNITVVFEGERDDSDIEEEIERRLAWDTRVDSAGVDVAVRDGDVTLTGEVPSLFQKGVSQSLAWVRGVNDVSIDPLEIAWWDRDEMLDRDILESKSDAAVADAVRNALLYDPRVRSFETTVIVEEGEVTLTGTVDNLQARRAAAETTANVHGVWEVNNMIEVDTEFEEFVDESITESIKRKLVANGVTDGLEISVSTNEGTVTLIGSADSALESRVARDIAATTPGVASVVNEIVVESSDETAVTDEALSQRIDDELFWSPVVDASDVEVSVDDGEVDLSGTVETMAERDAAIDNAYEAGALEVDADQLLVAFGAAHLVPEGIAY